MSAGYGKNLTEEDPNKKKLSEGTTPSATATTPTTGTTAPGGTTTPPLGIDGFVGTGTGSNAYQTNVGFYNDQYNTAVDAAKTNKDLGMEYIEGVKNSIYGNAAAQRAEADKNTEVARQRGIIDSQSSYQRAVGAYGSNAETLAGRGLSGSGYGEYLTADAYATHRGQVQNINADALRANREAAYAESQAKMAADSEYLKNLYGINTEYNNAISKAKSDLTTGMYQAALGLNEAQNAAYGKLFDSAAKGVSLDAIMQDGTWGDLTPEQQQAITAEAERIANEKSKAEGAEQNYINDTNFGNWVTSIGNGSVTLDQIKAMSGYENLTDAQKGQLQTAENNRVAKSGLADKTERADRIVTYGDLARGGMSLDELKATMALYGDDWDNLDPKEQKVIQMAADAYTAAQKKLESEDRPNQIAGLADLAAKGYSIDEIKQWAAIYGITDLNENELAVIQSSADRYAAAQDKLESDEMTDRYFGYSELADAGYSIDDIKAMMGIYGDEYISAEEYEKLDNESKKAKAEARKYSALIDSALGRYSSVQEKLESENEMDRALGYADLAENGYSIDDIKSIMAMYGDQYISKEDYDKLSDDDKKKYADARKFSEVIDRAITRYSNLKTETANKDAKGALEAYIKAAGAGLSIDAITAIAMANGHYDVLVGEKVTEEGKEGEESKTLWDAVVAEAEKLTNQNATNDTLTNIEDAINDGATLDEIKEMPGYDELDDTDKSNIKQAVNDRDEGAFINSANNVLESGGGLDELQNIEGFDAWTGAERDEAIRKASDNTINSMVTKSASLDEIKNSEAWATASTAVKDQVEAYYKEQAELNEGTANTVLGWFDELPSEETSSIDSLDEFLNSYTDDNGKPLSDEVKNKVRGKWIDRNVKEVTDGIGGAKFQNGQLVYGSDDITAEDIYNGVVNGIFGDKASEVVTKYLDTLKTTANNASTTLSDIVAVQGMLTTLRDDLRMKGGYQSLVNMVDKALAALTRKVRTYDNETVGETKINGETYTTLNGVAVKPHSETLRLGNLYNQLNNIAGDRRRVRVGDKMYARVSNVWYVYDIVEG